MATRMKLSSTPAFQSKVETGMHEFKEGALHSGSKTGPLVTDPKQAIAISLNQARKRVGAPMRRRLS